MLRKWKDLLGASRPKGKPELPLDLTAPGFVQDPAPVYAWLRENAPLAEVASGGFLLTRHADIKAAFVNPGLGNTPSRFSVLSARHRQTHVAADVAAHIPPFLDKPDHVPMRKALSAAFFDSFGAAQAWLPELASQMVAQRRGQPFDLIADLAQPYVCTVMARFVGLPQDLEAIGVAADRFFHLFAPIRDREVLERTNAALTEARAFVLAAVAARQAQPQEDLISHLLAAGLGPLEVADNALLVLADGIENIKAGIAMALDVALAKGLRGHEADIDAITRECLRLSTPGQIIPRVTRAPITLLGQDLGEGVPVFLALGSANLDPQAHPDPLTFRPDRDLKDALLFGQGRHRCIGEPLGVLQVSAMLTALLQAGVQRTDDAPLRYLPRFGHRWPAAMAVRVGA